MKRIIGVLLSVLLCTLLLTGCGQSDAWNPLKSDKELNIAVLGSSTEFEERQDFLAGVDLAIAELAQEGITIKYKLFGDGGSYDNGITNAQQVATDEKFQMAFTFQSFEIVDTIATLFNDAKKPLFIIDGCYDKTMNAGYEYVFNMTISAEDAGNALGQYVIKKGYKWIAVAHSNSEYSLNFQEGFNDAVSGNGVSTIIDLVSGPNKQSEFDEVWNRWKVLGVQAVVLSFDDMDWAVELVKLIKERDPNMKILADAYFNDLSYMNDYGKYLEGMIMPSSYPVDSNEKLQRFYDENESKITYLDITSISAQGFDLIKMIASNLKEVTTAKEFVESMMNEKGYNGVTQIKFKQSGKLDKTPKYWVIKNGKVWREENENAK